MWVEKARRAGLSFVDKAFQPGAFPGEATTLDDIVDAYTRINPNPAQAAEKSRKGIYRFLPPHSREGGKGGNEYIASTVCRQERSRGWWKAAVPNDDPERRIMQIAVGNDLSRIG